MSVPKTPDLPLGPEVDSTPAQLPTHMTLRGRFATLEPLMPAHADELFPALCAPAHAALWTYMADGPFPSLTSFRASIAHKSASRDPLWFAVRSGSAAVGLATLMRIDTPNRAVEVGNIVFALEGLQRTRAATECMYLLARWVFEELGFRRYEWKCNDLNERSKSAARRLGFVFEGVFRQHYIVKGRSRDTAWFAMLDGEWPRVKRAFERWLDDGNFDAEGRQIEGLTALREAESEQ